MRRRLNTLHIDTRSRLRISRALLLVVLAFLYVIFFVPAHTNDTVVLPAWVTPPLTTDSITTSISSAPAVPFLYNRLFGYISPAGEIIMLLPVPYGIAYSNKYHSLYNPINHPIPLHRNDGKLVRTIDRHGYPLLYEDRVFILHQNGNSISEWNQRMELWRRDFSAIISAIDVKQTHTAISFFDGHAIIVDQAGKHTARLSPPATASHVFSTIALSDDQQICAVYEATQSQLLIFTLNDEEEQLIRTINMRSETRENPPFPYITFLPDSRNIIYYDGADLYLYHFETAETTLLHHAVSLLDIDMNNSYLAVITRNIVQTLLSVYTVDGNPLLRTTLTDTSSISDHFVRFSDQDTRSLILGIENRIIALQHQEQW